MTRARCLLIALVAAGGAVGAGASFISGCDSGMDDGPVIPGPSTPVPANGSNGSGEPPPGGEDGGTGTPTTDARVFDAGFPDTNQFPDAAIPLDGPIIMPVR
jgi:hypothetical protein